MTESAATSREQIYDQIRSILRTNVKGVDASLVENSSESTKVISDLDLESVTIVEFCMALGKHFRKKFPFQNLVFANGQFQDFTLGELAAFVEKQLNAQR